MSDITRKEHINRLKAMQDCIKHCVDPNYQCDDCDNCEINYMQGNLGEIKETLAYAIASLETDEAYDLMYEQPEFCKDCISREAVEKITWEEPTYTDALNALTEVREKVRALPSVLPKATTKDYLGVDYLGVKFISKSDVDKIIDCPYFRQADKLIQIMNLPSVTFKDPCDTCRHYENGCHWLSSVTPQEPFINKPCVSEKVCKHDKQMVLDKIRSEIEQNAYPIVHGVNNHEKGMTLYGILQVIDKYKAESEG